MKPCMFHDRCEECIELDRMCCPSAVMVVGAKRMPREREAGIPRFGQWSGVTQLLALCFIVSVALGTVALVMYLAGASALTMQTTAAVIAVAAAVIALLGTAR